MRVSKLLFVFSIFPVLFACNTNSSTEESTSAEVVTPVTITSVIHKTLSDSVELNATANYLKTSFVKASSNGYIQSVNLQLGQQVKPGQTLFTLITKEARAIGNTINNLNPDFNFSGVTVIKATTAGLVSQVDHQKGDYVQDGEQLAIIQNTASMAFVLNLPYELKQVINRQKAVELILPDGERLTGTITSSLPSVDSVSQTQKVLIQVKTPAAIPQNLIAKVRIAKTVHPDAASLPKEAVLSNETQDQFWVMKLINDTTAVKVPVKTGIETDKSTEILSPAFNDGDHIVLTGNYGLADTAKVKIVKQ